MQCKIVPAQIKVLVNALDLLCRCGEYTQINVKRSGLELSTLNDAQSEFLEIKFKESFFEEYNIRKKNRSERESDDCDSFFLSQTKVFKLIFTKLSIVENVEWSISGTKMIVKFNCKHNLEKKWTLNVEREEVKQAVVYKDSCYGYFSSDPKLLLQLLATIHSKMVRVQKRTDGITFTTSGISAREDLYSEVSIDFSSLLQYSFCYANITRDIRENNLDLPRKDIERYYKFIDNPRLYSIQQNRRRKRERGRMTDEDDDDEDDDDDDDALLEMFSANTDSPSSISTELSQSAQTKKMRQTFSDMISPPIPMETTVKVANLRHYFNFCHKNQFALDFLLKNADSPLVLLSNNTKGMNDVKSKFICCSTGEGEEREDDDDDDDDDDKKKKKEKDNDDDDDDDKSEPYRRRRKRRMMRDETGDVSQTSESVRISSYSSSSQNVSMSGRKTGFKRKRRVAKSQKGGGDDDDDDDEEEDEGEGDDDDDVRSGGVNMVDEDDEKKVGEPERRRRKTNPVDEDDEDEDDDESGRRPLHFLHRQQQQQLHHQTNQVRNRPNQPPPPPPPMNNNNNYQRNNNNNNMGQGRRQQQQLRPVPQHPQNRGNNFHQQGGNNNIINSDNRLVRPPPPPNHNHRQMNQNQQQMRQQQQQQQHYHQNRNFRNNQQTRRHPNERT